MGKLRGVARGLFGGAMVLALVSPACRPAGPKPQEDATTAAPSGADAAAVPPAPSAPAAEPRQKVAGERSLRLTVAAKFENLPAGARVVAPSARDRQQVRVTRSEHTGLPGQVTTVEGADSLLYVSGPVAGGAADYGASFDVTLRPSAAPDLAQLAEIPWPEGEAPTPAPGPAALAPVASSLVGDAVTPAARTSRLLEAVRGFTVAPDGASDPAEVATAKRGTAFGVVATFVGLLGHAGVPARVVHGFELPAEVTGAARPGVWAEVQLPMVGWVTIDPIGPAPAEGAAAAARIPLVYGTEHALPGTPIVLRSALGAPLAVAQDGSALIEPAELEVTVTAPEPAPAE